MTPWLEALVCMLVWAGVLLLHSAMNERRKPDLADRLMPYQRPWIADEAEQWLRTQEE